MLDTIIDSKTFIFSIDLIVKLRSLDRFINIETLIV